MTDRNRRRDLMVRMRHKDVDLVVFARQANRRDRYTARLSLREAMRGVEVEDLDLDATSLLSDGTRTLPWSAL